MNISFKQQKICICYNLIIETFQKRYSSPIERNQGQFQQMLQL